MDTHLAGRRVRIADWHGTHLGNDYLLLDEGHLVHAESAAWRFSDKLPRLPVMLNLLNDTVRLFERRSVSLVNLDRFLRGQRRLALYDLKPLAWDHSRVVAGQIHVNRGSFWVIINELKLPERPIIEQRTLGHA